MDHKASEMLIRQGLHWLGKALTKPANHLVFRPGHPGLQGKGHPGLECKVLAHAPTRAHKSESFIGLLAAISLSCDLPLRFKGASSQGSSFKGLLLKSISTSRKRSKYNIRNFLPYKVS